LREAGASLDKDIRQYYDSFVLELNKRQVEMLEARNVRMRKPFLSSAIAPIRKAG
jgi:hypothetical protein